jgi:hypothetical protein
VDLDIFEDDQFKRLPQAADLRAYIEEGRPTNHFLTALLENDLMACMGRADDRNLAALKDYCEWLKSFAPGLSYGSPERVAAWIASGGLKGRE